MQINRINSFKRNLAFSISLFSFITASGQVRDSVLNLDEKDDRNQTVVPTKDNYLFVYDGLYDMTGSAQNLLSVSHLFGRGLDALTCKPDENTVLSVCCKKGNFFGRVLIDGLNFIFSNWLSTVQHECMGHGFRAREFNARINSYEVNFILFSGPRRLDFHREDLPYYGILIEEPGGSESNTIFSRESFRQSLLNDCFYHYYFYEFALKIDLPMYIIGTPKVGSYEWINYTGGWDIVRYIKSFKIKSKDDEQQILASALKGAYWSLADPSLLISLFKYTRDYIVQGKAHAVNPMIKIKNIAFLPYTDFHLSPFGHEYYTGIYLRYNKTLYEAYYRWGNGNIDGKSCGIGINMINLIRSNTLKFDAGFDLWKQGFNLLYYEKDDAKYRKRILSGKIVLRTIYRMNNTLSFWGQASYKGDGFLLGNPVKKGFNAKIGMAFYF